ncbi:MAG: MG2 domain-containing protein [Bdellovibrionota bacterium]
MYSIKNLRSLVSVCLLVMALGAAAFGGCQRKKDDQTAAGGVVAGVPAGGPTEISTGGPLTAENIRPSFRLIGEEGVSPRQIEISFSQNVFSTSQVTEKALKEAVLSLSPEVEGRLLPSGPASLLFEPEKPFPLQTKFTVSLERLGTRDGVFEPPSKGAWEFKFETPSFRLVRISPYKVSKNQRNLQVELDVVFSGAVDLGSLRRSGKWLIDGAGVSDIIYQGTNQPNVARVKLSPSTARTDAQVQFVMMDGVRFAGDRSVTAPATEENLYVKLGEPVTIYEVNRLEGASGHFVEIICDDRAVGGQNWYRWDPATEKPVYVSDKCVLRPEEAETSIHFDPPIQVSISPGRRGFRLLGDFKRGSYHLRIDAGARSEDGGVLGETRESWLTVPERSPSVAFGSKGRYLPEDSWGNLPIRHLNVDEVTLTAHHIGPENVVFWLSGPTEQADERTADLVLRKTLKVSGALDEEKTSWADLSALLPNPKRGVYELKLEAKGKSDTARIALTNLNLIAKRSSAVSSDEWGKRMNVWAIDAHTAAPVSGVQVKWIVKSGRSVATCSTDGQGGCLLEATSFGEDKSEPFALIATKGEDFTFLKFEELQVDLGDAEVQGDPYERAAAYSAALYSDRGVYRPGEMAHFVGIVRDKAYVAPPEGVPVELVLTDPRGRVLARQPLKTNDAGIVSYDHRFADFADTGAYKLGLEIAKTEVALYDFKVEEFVPERMRVKADAGSGPFLIRETVPVTVDAEYLFGGDAEGSRFELSCQIEPSSFKPSKNSEFTYGVWNAEKSRKRALLVGNVTGTLGKKGHGEAICPSPLEAGAFRGPGELVARASVFEAGSGRSTTGMARAAVHPEHFYLGLASGAKAVGPGAPVTVEGVVVDWKGELFAGVKDVELQVFHIEQELNWYSDDEDFGRYERIQRLVSEGRKKVPVNDGKFQEILTPVARAVGYVIRARSGNAETDLYLEGDFEDDFSWWFDVDQGPSRRDETPRPLRPKSLPLSVPVQVKVGEKVKVTAEVPYRGRILFTLETNRILESEWVNADKGSVTWDFKVEDLVPNVYVSAFLIKDPHLDSKEAFLPGRAFGVQSVKVEPAGFAGTVSVSAPKEILPNSDLTVSVDVGAISEPTYVTVAAVDEGILQLTNFKTPDPLAQVFANRALGISTFETVGWMLALPPPGPSRATGGDEEAKSAPGRVQPIKPVALWSGLVKVPENGKTTVKLAVPQFRGELRVMAVRAGSTRLAGAATSTKVRDPLVLQTTLPRFLTSADTVQVPVFVTNLSGAAQKVKVTIEAEPIGMLSQGVDGSRNPVVEINGRKERELQLADGQSGTAVFELKAVASAGAAAIHVTATGGGRTSRDDLEVPILPSGPEETRMQRIELAKGELDLKRYLTGWAPMSEHSSLWVTPRKYGDVFSHVSHLLEYPYGCIEQTTSTTRTVMFVSQLLPSIEPELAAKTAEIPQMVQHGIERALSMQTASGGFGYWPGTTRPYYWATAFATHMLLDAKKLGYNVPEDRLNSALDFIENAVNTGGNEWSSGYWYHNAWENAEAYSHYVLALAGRARKARIAQLIEHEPENMEWEKDEQLYLLKAALYLAGDRRYERDLKKLPGTEIPRRRFNDWCFYSALRHRAFVLSTFSDLFGNDPAADREAEALAEVFREHESRYFSTQELGWGLTALGKIGGSGSSDFDPPHLFFGKKELPAASGQAKTSERSWSLYRASEYPELTLDVGDTGKGPLYLILTSKGVRTNTTYPLGGKDLDIQRRYFKPDGTELRFPSSRVGLGDLVFVEIALTNQTKDDIRNVALVDRFPAGWEIENPRLGRSNAANWINPDELWELDYMNIRDDRFEVFGALKARETRRVVYALRATLAGSYTVPPVSAEAMYDPEQWARAAGTVVEVTGPWAAYLQ